MTSDAIYTVTILAMFILFSNFGDNEKDLYDVTYQALENVSVYSSKH